LQLAAQLKHLDLEANHVKDDGALAFAAAFRQEMMLFIGT
jgi:hypothetical protein